jgi:methylmalonyl-CoA epimerase
VVPVLTEIDHVAIAVYDLDEAIDEHRESFDVWVDHREVLDDDGVEVALIKVADSYIQLLTPTRDDSVLAAFLEARGPGLHHVGYRVADCAATLAALIEAGHEVVDTEPRRGVRGTTTAFIHPHTMFGTLVQLVEE